MNGRGFCKGSVVLLAGLMATGCAAPPGPAPTTVWDTMGVTGAMNALGNAVNKSGNVPQLEPKPPLKRIADAANLESPTPAIKKAAEVKQAEDQARQKVKAVKYLAKMGCGCYDEDGSISEALVAAMDDCTEAVRYETVNALYEQARRVQGGECPTCSGSCCNQDIVDKLWNLAYGYKDNGCCVESSERVREMAIRTMELCCPTQCESYNNMQYEPEPVEPEKNLEGPMDAPTESPAPPAEEAPKEASLPIDLPEAAQSSTGKSAEFRQVAHSQPAPAREVAAKGSVSEIALDTNTATVRFDRNVLVPTGARLAIHHRHQLGRISTLGEVEVCESEPGRASVRPVGLLSLRRLALNDLAVLYSSRSPKAS
jgi:hypothetical protein